MERLAFRYSPHSACHSERSFLPALGGKRSRGISSLPVAERSLDKLGMTRREPRRRIPAARLKLLLQVGFVFFAQDARDDDVVIGRDGPHVPKPEVGGIANRNLQLCGTGSAAIH